MQVGHLRVVFVFEGFDDAPQHGGHDEGGGDLFGAGQLDPGLRREVGELDRTTAGIDGTQDRGDSGDMVRRHADQCGFRSVGGHEVDGSEDVGDQMPLSQHRRLRHTCCAAGEK